MTAMLALAMVAPSLAAGCSCSIAVSEDGGRSPDAETALDAGSDAGFDAGSDAGLDAGSDAGLDAGFDAALEYDSGSDAGPPRPTVVTEPCDDLNACTDDREVSTGGGDLSCEHSAVADGVFCDDGDLCTLADSCRDGACNSGVLAAGPAEVLGATSPSFGGRFNRAIAVGQGRVLFDDGRLTLARAAGGRLEVLDRTESNSLGILVPMGGGRVLFGRRDRTLGIVEASASDRIVVRGEATPPSTIPSVDLRDLTTANGQAWGCAGDAVNGYFLIHAVVGSPDSPIITGSRRSAVDPRVLGSASLACRALALSPDGSTLYVATSDLGLYRFPVLAAADPSVTPVLEPGERIFGPTRQVSAYRDFLVVIPDATAPLEILRVSDLSPVASLTGSINNAMLTPRGLLTFQQRPATGGAIRLVALHSFDPTAGLSFIAEEIVGPAWGPGFLGAIERAEADRPANIRPASDATTAVATVAKGVYGIHDDAPVFRQATSVDVGFHPYVWADGDLVSALGDVETRVDIADPTMPIRTETVPDATQGSVLHVPAAGMPRLSGHLRRFRGQDMNLILRTGEMEVRSYAADGSEAARRTILLETGSSGAQRATLSHWYAVTHTPGRGDTRDLRIQRWRLAALVDAASPAPTPGLDVTLRVDAVRTDGDPSAASVVAFGVSHDERSMAVVIDNPVFMPAVGPGPLTVEYRRVLLLVDMAGDGARIVSQTVLGGENIFDEAVAVDDGRVALFRAGVDGELLFFELRGDGSLAERGRREFSEDSDFVAFDGVTAYVDVTSAVEAIRFDDPTGPSVRYSLDGDGLSSWTTSARGLIFGSSQRVHVARPWCP